MHAQTQSALALGLLLAVAPGVTAQTESTFLYQGMLHEAGAPADGTYDLTFYLWNAPAGGSQVGDLVDQPGVNIQDGLFSVPLDFGDEVFDGSARWLEVWIGGTPVFPRQPINASPYAIHTRGIHVDAANDVGLGTTSPLAMLHIDGSNSSHSVLRLDSPGASTGSIEFNSPRGHMGLAATAPNGQRRDIWFMDGGLGLFTSNSGDAPIAGDGLFIDSGGRVGVGTTQPGWDFNVVGNSLFNGAIAVQDEGISVQDGGISAVSEQLWPIYGQTDGVGAGNYAANGVYGYASRTTGWANGVWGETKSNEGAGVLGWASALNGDTRGVVGFVDSPNGKGVAGYSRANSGVGYGVYGEADSPNGAGVYAVSYATSGNAIALLAQTNSPSGFSGYFIGPSGSQTYFQQSVGIGVLNPSYRLHLSSNSAAKPTSDRWTISSDERLKKNIRPLQGALDDVLRLRGVTYQWRDPDSQGGMTGTYHGMIAQDVEKVFPEWVDEDTDGFKTLTITGFEGVMVEALRELCNQKDAEIAELTAYTRTLEHRLAAVERALGTAATPNQRESR